jgi:hypothetical protein
MDEKETKERIAPVIIGVGRGIRRELDLQPPTDLTPQLRDALRRLYEAESSRPGGR